MVTLAQLMTLENGSTVGIRTYLFSFFFFLSFSFDICLYARNGSFFPSSISSIAQSPTDINALSLSITTAQPEDNYKNRTFIHFRLPLFG